MKRLLVLSFLVLLNGCAFSYAFVDLQKQCILDCPTDQRPKDCGCTLIDRDPRKKW